MKSLPTELVLQKNVWSDKDPWLLLVTVALVDDASTVHRFAANSQDVDYQSNTYIAMGFTTSAVASASQGALSEIVITLSNVARLLVADLTDPDDVNGSLVTLLFVHYDNLTVDHSVLEVTYKIKSYRITGRDVEFNLGDETLVIAPFPPRRYDAVQCEWAPDDFKGSECQYVGAESTCDGLIKTCRTRAAGSNMEHFGGFPLLHGDGLKVAKARG